jgi:hypothetical protein
MFHAIITSETRNPLRLSGEVAPYDLQVLREHVLARCRRGTRVRIKLAPAFQEALLRALSDLGKRGVELVLES